MDSQQARDLQAIAKVLHGDVDAYAQIVGDYEAKLTRYVVYLTHNDHLSADVVQDAFISAYQNLNGFNAKYQFSSWLYRIAHNMAINAVKRDSKINRDADAEALADEQAHEPGVIKKIDQKIMQGQVNACLDKLEQKYREVMMLRFFEDMTYDEIADILHIPPATAGVWINRGKQKLRAICEQKGVTL